MTNRYFIKVEPERITLYGRKAFDIFKLYFYSGGIALRV